MKLIKKLIIVSSCVLLLCVPVAVNAFAVDPVSAATMANAFAQAITAYGASQGVSMTFDVANTDGIGEGVHALWNKYQADMANNSVTVSDYENLASSAFPSLWSKTFQYVTVNLDAATRGEVDGFWNWLLSGPAEMTKVDNEYYEWTLNQNNLVDPILVNSQSILSLNGVSIATLPQVYYTEQFYNNSFSYSQTVTIESSSSGGIIFIQNQNNLNEYTRCVIFESNAAVPYTATFDRSNGYHYSDNYSASWNIGSIYYLLLGQVTVSENTYGNSTRNFNSYNIPIYVGDPSSITSVFGDLSHSTINSVSDNVSVQPYIGDAAPQNVYIPDNTDVNYEAEAVSIPIDVTWDDTIFGDGSGTLTDAQSESITSAVSDAITDSIANTLELADTANPPAPNPSEVYIPLLPITLPSFNFSLSGIWHYVTAWVASLGAWFTMVFSLWAVLPYAIVVPVYATAVIVIVLGVYKRFFM